MKSLVGVCPGRAGDDGPPAVRSSDSRSGYGWISIALHWLTAVIVLTMFVIGTLSQSAGEADYPRLVHLHTTIGMTAYVLLWGRIVWRFAVGHPGPLPRQGGSSSRSASTFTS